MNWALGRVWTLDTLSLSVTRWRCSTRPPWRGRSSEVWGYCRWCLPPGRRKGTSSRWRCRWRWRRAPCQPGRRRSPLRSRNPAAPWPELAASAGAAVCWAASWPRTRPRSARSSRSRRQGSPRCDPSCRWIPSPPPASSPFCHPPPPPRRGGPRWSPRSPARTRTGRSALGSLGASGGSHCWWRRSSLWRATARSRRCWGPGWWGLWGVWKS